jgi:RimJ/RimL family protein N-acetyltransferase
MLERNTERLTLRPFQREDAGFVLRLANDPAFLDAMEDKGIRTRVEALRHIEGTLAAAPGQWLVVLQATGQAIGLCGLVCRVPGPEVDLDYAFLPEGRGRGYALEAAREVLDWARRELGLPALFALVAPANVRSVHLLGRLGFAFAQALDRNPGPGQVHLYALDLAPFSGPDRKKPD